MNMPIASSQSRPHPMLIVAGTTVVLFCLTGTAAIMGWIPSSAGRTPDAAAVALSAAPNVSAPRGPAGEAPLHAAPSAGTHGAWHAAAPRPAAAPVCRNCGVVESTREARSGGDASGLGAAGGAVVGGLLGNQVGGGRGREAMTVAGAIGGALAGNQIERQARTVESYVTTVRMNDGSSRTVSQATPPEWRNGDRVRIVDGVVRLNG